MISFVLSMLALVVGYLFYGRLVEKIFGVQENRITPALAINDGVDYMPIDWKRGFLIQLLNIAGLGPIFGAVAGAYWGPVAFLWIVLGCIFAGATHDYLAGMLSLRHDGKSIAEIIGFYLGTSMQNIMRIFTVLLLILVGAVFITGPADILESMTGISRVMWIGLIIIYYLLATVLPVDKIIGKIYPLFGSILIVMTVAIILAVMVKGYIIPEMTLANLHPERKAIFPYLFITIACGAISGFHATQAPIMARCLPSEKLGRRVFYGSMIAEGMIALIWAAAAMAFYGDTSRLATAGTAAVVVSAISIGVLGKFGGILTLIGVVICPVTSGDTSFRSARLTIADALHLDQHKLGRRFLIAIPMFVIGTVLCFMDFAIVWRYVAWANQTLGAIILWTSATYLMQNQKFHWICSLPATFMTVVTTTYILLAPEGFHLPAFVSYPLGLTVGLSVFIYFIYCASKQNRRLLKTRFTDDIKEEIG